VNKMSLNIFGGYTGGLDGLELGGLFNIDKGAVRGGQGAGLVNIAGGPVRGIQMAGIHNSALDSLSGYQLAGFTNYTHRKLHGIQAAGFYNHLSDSLRGSQLAGLANFSAKRSEGAQIAGFANFTIGETHGAQIAGFLNYTRKLKGVQIALINICDTSEGYSIGLIDIVRKGMHSLSLFADEVSPFHFAYRSGNDKLYSIFLAGFNPDIDNKAYYLGFGLGHSFEIGKLLSLNPELSSERVAPGYQGQFTYVNLLNKFRLNINWRLSKYFQLSAGPSLAVYYDDHDYIVNGHVFAPPDRGYCHYSFSGKTSGWIGWQAGISLL
jgi:hypothetical protein